MDQIITRLKPKVSVNMITFNQGAFVAQAIESVLSQNFTNWELIIIDDASTDDTKNAIARYFKDQRIKYFKNEKNLGICLSRNRALRESTGEYIAILDSDDFWNDKDKLKNQIDFLDDNHDYAVIGTGVVTVDEDGNNIKHYLNPLEDVEIRNQMLKKNPLANSSVMYRRQTVTEIENYNLGINGIEDYDLWLRLGKKYKMANLPDHCLSYRTHSNNITSTNRERLMKLNLQLIDKYHDNYPSYLYARYRRLLRFWIFKVICLINFK
ncbi:MAG: glycosyltransferase family 2 protein [Candidatus Vogelbacteria bacterium]|nr:glycosyltransferase family 2 protein [Candidatus Vogelbacteria bacterium]